MRFAIISDTHDNLANLEKFTQWAKKENIETLIHCGDIAQAETLAYLVNNFSGPIHAVYGNMDESYKEVLEQEADKHDRVTLHGDSGEIEIAGLKIGFIHFPEEARVLCKDKDFVFYGHTHKPWEEKVGECRLVNPGTLAGLFNKATFAVYDSDAGKPELKLVERL